MEEIEEIHIGKLLQKRIEEEGIREKWMAEKMNCSASKISRLYQHKSMHTDTLIEICMHLEYNFFDHYVEYVDKQIEKENRLLLHKLIKNGIHIGEIIHKVEKEEGKKSKWVADQIHRSPNDMQDIYKRKNMDNDLLVDICKCLKYNFFKLYADYTNEQLNKKGWNIILLNE